MQASAEDNALVVRTASGKIRGAARPTGGAEFLGIPYAQPPVGNLRWHEPLPAKTWSGVRDATAFGASCAQSVSGEWNRRAAETSSEDCLYLNVMTPEWPAKKPLPVMFWIHGGGNTGGTASSALYKDGTLINHGVLLVTVNYRLGIFGFFSHPGLTRESAHGSSGNYGLMDQIAALGWVIDNIAKFGGDPKNITVFGQSAGAQDTGLLMTSRAKNWFQRAIPESGTPLLVPLLPLAESEQAGVAFAAQMKAPAGDGVLKFLRGISAAELLNAISTMHGPDRPLMAPNIDGWVITRSPAEVFAFGQESAIPLLIGSNSMEFGSSDSADQVRKEIQEKAGEFAPEALAIYGLADGGQRAVDPLYGSPAAQWTADTRFRCPASTEAAWHNAAHHPTYEYEFQRASPGHEAVGAIHSAELPYVFGYFPHSGQFSFASDFAPVDFKLSQLMETYWTNFAKTGDPNSSGVTEWPQFGDAQSFIQFTQDGQAVAAAKLRGRQCDLYRQMLSAQMEKVQ
ncbi:MAG: carboxylesterase family protein [Terracidiphilus sp.]